VPLTERLLVAQEGICRLLWQTCVQISLEVGVVKNQSIWMFQKKLLGKKALKYIIDLFAGSI